MPDPAPSPLCALAASPRYALGIDENGLGPRLGPLVVTAILVRAERDVRPLFSKPRGKLKERLGDSKQLASYNDSTLGEAWARVLVQRVASSTASVPSELLQNILADERSMLRSRCPDVHGAQCWDDAGERFSADDTLLRAVEKDLVRLERRGFTVVRVRSVVVCAERLNDAAALGKTRFILDLHAMERLFLDAREAAGEEIVCLSGKVGGYDRYADAFGPLAGRLHITLAEGRAKSEYKFPGLGTLSFARDADAGAMLVGMASLVGKWVRDHFMRRIVRYHRAENPELPDASGYHDPVTTRFIQASRLSRKRRMLPNVCFERSRALRPSGLTKPANHPKGSHT